MTITSQVLSCFPFQDGDQCVEFRMAAVATGDMLAHHLESLVQLSPVDDEFGQAIHLFGARIATDLGFASINQAPQQFHSA
jgi:hypothetical protein